MAYTDAQKLALAIKEIATHPKYEAWENIVRIFKLTLPEFESPRADTVSHNCGRGVEIRITNRSRGKGIAEAWQDGVKVYGMDLRFNETYIPGEWEKVVAATFNALKESTWQDQMHALALPGCVECKGYGVRLNEGELIACDCTEKREPSFEQTGTITRRFGFKKSS